MLYILTSSQTNYLSILDGTADRVTSQSSERIDFYCDHEEADTKMFAYVKFLCDISLNRIIIVSPDADVTVISSVSLSVTNITFLDAVWF